MKQRVKMKKNISNRIKAAALAAAVALQSVAAPAAGVMPLASLTAYADSGFVNTDRLNVRSGPGTSYDKVATIGAGSQVSINGETTGSDGQVWYSISFNGGSGYARHDFISRNVTYAVQSGDFEEMLNQQGFPESYKNGLRGLHEKYPNWTFKAFQTGLDWNTVIEAESRIGRNLVDKNSISSWKSIADGAFDWAGNYWPGFDGATWVQASTELIAYYMDPRNFLTDPYIFQFEHQTYNPAIQTRDGLANLVNGTFLAGDAIVPVEGSQIEGGTIIEGSTYGSGSTGSGAAGPGSGSSGYAVIGPGTSSSSSSGSGSTASGGYAVVGGGGTVISSGSETTAPVEDTGSSDDGFISLTGPGDSTSSILDKAVSVFDRLGGVMTAYAAKWRQESDPVVRWVYVNDDGTYLSNGWYWLDGNNDGIAECYYFYEDGTMAADTTVDGYVINSEGKWVHGSGEPYTKSVGTSSAGSTAASSSDSSGGSSADSSQGTVSQSTAGQLKKVPYVDIIMKAAETSNVSPYVLAAAILQEQGKGTSDLISGKNSKYPGVYNFYNTGAYAHDGMGAVEAGLKYASESGNGGRPWTTIEKAIIGGASAYAASYVAQGQDTFYLKKFNVQGSNKFNHQFMTHVLGAASEGAKVSNAYSSAVKGGSLEFSIPVYQNMPESTTLPAGDGNPNNKLKSLSVDGYTITPTFSMDTPDYSLIVDGSSAYVNINAIPIDSGASVSGAGSVGLNVGSNDISIVVRAANGSERTYRLSITRREDSSVFASMAGQVPGYTGSTDANGASYNAAGAGPGAAVVSSGSGSTESSGYVIVGPGASGGQAVIQDQTVQETAGSSDAATVVQDDGGDGMVLIGAGPQ